MNIKQLNESFDTGEIYNKNGSWYIFADGYERELSGHELSELELVGGFE